MAYKIIRCGLDYTPVIVVTPDDAEPETPNAKYYRWDAVAQTFQEISALGAMTYFSGHADGLGWQDYPTQPFETLDEIAAMIIERHGRSRVSVRMEWVDLDTAPVDYLATYRMLMETIARMRRSGIDDQMISNAVFNLHAELIAEMNPTDEQLVQIGGLFIEALRERLQKQV